MLGAMECQADEPGSNPSVVTVFFLSFLSKILLSFVVPYASGHGRIATA